jgi:hypothetical protein
MKSSTYRIRDCFALFAITILGLFARRLIFYIDKKMIFSIVDPAPLRIPSLSKAWAAEGVSMKNVRVENRGVSSLLLVEGGST